MTRRLETILKATFTATAVLLCFGAAGSRSDAGGKSASPVDTRIAAGVNYRSGSSLDNSIATGSGSGSASSTGFETATGLASDPNGANIPAHTTVTTGRRTYIDEQLRELIDEKENIIIDPSHSLAPLIEKLRRVEAGAGEVVNILHVGDSHVQAGFWDGRMRGHFSRDFGYAGRGVILPHKLSGTNEPRDYYIRTDSPHEAFRTTKNPTREKLSFTGTAVLFEGASPRVELWQREGFNSVTVHHHPYAPRLAPPDSLLQDFTCIAADTEHRTVYHLNRMVDTLTLTARYWPREYLPMYYGFSLGTSPRGVAYHAVGANSAAFEHFQRQTNFIEGGASELDPDLIIISLGTNNCYGRNYRSDNLQKVVERFLEAVAENYPGTPVIVTTPRESCKPMGGRRGYEPNPNVEDAARVIRQSAARYGMACWDLYRAAGGRGIAEGWFAMKLSGRDRIHLTESGYNLVGDMFYEAIMKYYDEYEPTPETLAVFTLSEIHKTAAGTAFFPVSEFNYIRTTTQTT